MNTYEHTYELLEAALGQIADENKWCQGSLYSGGRVCAAGALIKAVFGASQLPSEMTAVALITAKRVPGSVSGPRAGYLALKAAIPPHPSGGFVNPERFNDFEPHAAVVALFQRAIRAEKQRVGVLSLDLVSAERVEVCA